MQRREFLKATGALALTPLVPAVAPKIFDYSCTKESEPIRTDYKDDPIMALGPDQIKHIRDWARYFGSEIYNRYIPQFVWDFAESIGDTIHEKYESLYEIVAKASMLENDVFSVNKLNAIFTTPEIASMFETATVGYDPLGFTIGKHVTYCGNINHRWRLYKTRELAPQDILLMKVSIRRRSGESQFYWYDPVLDGKYWARPGEEAVLTKNAFDWRYIEVRNFII